MDFKQMEIYERIKYLRKSELHMTQEQFAKELLISRSSLSVIEIGEVKVTERNILTICLTYGINKEWLLNGTEPIFRELSKEEEIASYIGKVMNPKNDGSFMQKFIHMLSQLEEDDWEVLAKMAELMKQEDNEKS